MTRIDPDVIADELADVGKRLLTDERTTSLAARVDGLSRDIARALSGAAPRTRRSLVCEAAHQAMSQGSADRGLLA